jgi:ABC-type phosphate transport system permease subunit
MRVFFTAAVTIMLSTAALAAIIGLKTAIYLSHFNY